ncbi:MAG: adenylate/guanylate cyclase domain-containing protein, partial [Nitrospira sp.]|nr:adenylate/guanylate cyclase domain-containing protein [Nitrospira sp.]
AGNLIPPVERARLLWDFAKARIAQGDHQAAALLYREALQCLEATAADALREQIENELEKTFRDSWLLHTAGRFVGHKMIELLLRESGRTGFRGETKNLTILFSDIRDFTAISEQLKSPEQIITFFNDYLSRMTRCIEYFGGMVDKFIGDAIMALFSIPESQPDDPVRAVSAALAMVTELERFNSNLPEDTPKIFAGIGLHAGNVVAGLIGSPQKRSYTVIGDPVNTASRLEGMTKQLGAAILVSQEIYEKLPDRFLIRPLGKYRPKGKTETIVVAEVMAEDDGSPHLTHIKQEIQEIHLALAAFENRDFHRAAVCFEALAEAVKPEEFRARGYKLLATKARELQENPPSSDWKGEIVLESK